jgi:predicted nucleic acid-binding protein
MQMARITRVTHAAGVSDRVAVATGVGATLGTLDKRLAKAAVALGVSAEMV